LSDLAFFSNISDVGVVNVLRSVPVGVEAVGVEAVLVERNWRLPPNFANLGVEVESSGAPGERVGDFFCPIPVAGILKPLTSSMVDVAIWWPLYGCTMIVGPRGNWIS